MRKRLWLTWERQRRNHTTSAALGARLFEFPSGGSPAARYSRSLLRTWWTLRSQRPTLIFAQNPSLLLANLATVYGRRHRTPVVVDAHNGALEAARRPNIRGLLARRALRTADATVVSNPALKPIVRRYGGRPLVLPDPLPTLQRRHTELPSGFNVLFVCTWAADEPYREVFAAAEQVPECRIWVTGRSLGRERTFGRPLPPNVELTGFVSDEDFNALLHSVDAVMDLTTREDCLVCGAYEAVAAETPLILSDTEALRNYFRRGTVFVENNAAAIAEGLKKARSHQPALARDVRSLKHDLSVHWETQRHAVDAHLATLEQRRVG